jgi:sugar phosphate isomerase/epimerase
MQLGFVSAILPDPSFDDVIDFAAAEGFVCVELMCWPLSDTGYGGPVRLEAQDRAYEATLVRRRAALVQSARYLRQFMADSA